MAKSLGELAKLDRVVHEPARLAILTALAECASADFTFLVRAIHLTAGNLNSHLTALEHRGLVTVEKRIHGKAVHTLVSLTSKGRRAIMDHWKQLDALRKEAGSLNLPGARRQATRGVS